MYTLHCITYLFSGSCARVGRFYYYEYFFLAELNHASRDRKMARVKLWAKMFIMPNCSPNRNGVWAQLFTRHNHHLSSLSLMSLSFSLVFSLCVFTLYLKIHVYYVYYLWGKWQWVKCTWAQLFSTIVQQNTTKNKIL